MNILRAFLLRRKAREQLLGLKLKRKMFHEVPKISNLRRNVGSFLVTKLRRDI